MDDVTRTVVHDDGAPQESLPPEPWDDAALRPGELVGRYRLVDQLGAGGMGVVWRAHDPRLGRTVAVKVLHEQRRRRRQAEARERLRREALALAKLSHPNVVAIYDVGVHGRRVFLAMEHVVGRTLDRWAADAPSLLQVLEVFEQIAAGLAAVHEAGFVHRDLKPANVMIARDGRVLVMDFGLARISDPESVSEHESTASSSGWGGEQPGGSLSTELTREGTVVGTPAYMAPEQHTGAGADARADQYALCVSLYEVLMGRRPFDGRDITELARRKEDGRLELHGGRLSLPRSLRALLRRGLHPDPERRFGGMEALRRQLGRVRRPRRAQRVAWATAGVAALGGMVWASTWHLRPEACETGEARMAEVWNDDAASALRASFEATALGYADDAAERAITRLDAHAAAWVEAHARACHDAGIDDTALDLRMRCLAEARGAMAATVELLTHADAVTVQHAASQVAGLPGLSRCEDPEALAAEAPRPTDPEAIATMEALQQRLDAVDALGRAGHYDEGRERARGLLQDAIALGHEPTIARARLRVATFEMDLGQVEAAATGLTEAALLASSSGDHPTAADAATRLVFVLAEELGQPDEAMRWARHAEAALERMPSDRLARARLDSNVGIVHAIKGEYDQALAAFELALTTKRELLGEEHPEVAGALENVALALSSLGRVSESEPLMRRSLDAMEAVLGAQHPDLAHSLMNLGHAVDELGRHDEAAEIYDRALGIARSSLGPRHPMTARILSAMGHVASAQDRLPQAEAHYREAAEIQRAVYGEHHPEVGWSLIDMAIVQAQLGRDQEALPLFARAIEVLEGTLGAEHDAVAHALVNQCRSLVEVGRIEEAEQGLERAGAILRRSFEPGHPSFAYHHYVRGALRRAQERFEEARAELAQALEISSAALGPRHPEVASTLLALGEVEHALGRREDAVAHLRQAVSLTEAGPLGEAFRAEARLTLAKALWDEPGTRDEAVTLARAARDGFAGYGAVFRSDLDEAEAWLREHPG
ncbi:serine/threonine-protein kinase [Paraliomyxa miuraensis]|uniref:serine/threonine-protein kinase n=1 Tax=Paraliomyxa miuraensis TaxID=376150 RepID=UPI0022563AFF|nr:serine/threonine-protein kinase [Paraliomyxa miuraensis]MCX4241927.1 serine/threonine-protein kinase [Paraliomyxa miuraensis]